MQGIEVASAVVPTFDTLDEMWIDTAQNLIECGHDLPSRDGPTKEILGFTARLRYPYSHFMFNPHRKMSPSYAAAELLWYLSGESNIEMVLNYAPQYQRFVTGELDDGVNAYGAYGARMKIHLGTLISFLKENPSTRQAVLSLWKPDDLAAAKSGGHNDIPCTMALIFMVRDGYLYLTTHMRSNDVWFGLPYDVFCFTSLQILVAQCLGLEVGWYQHTSMSMHLYSRNSEKTLKAAHPPSFDTGSLKYSRSVGNMHSLSLEIETALKLEKHNRKIKVCADEVEPIQWGVIGQAIVLASLKWSQEKTAIKRIEGPLMRKYVERFFS